MRVCECVRDGLAVTGCGCGLLRELPSESGSHTRERSHRIASQKQHLNTGGRQDQEFGLSP